MRILYHHRTRSTDAQRIHILAIIDAFRQLGHEVEEVALVPAETEMDNPERDAQEAPWKSWAKKIPLAYEAIQLAYNLVGTTMLLRRLRPKPGFIYERYSLFNFAGVLSARLGRLPLVLEVNSPFALEQSRDREIRWHGLALFFERLICRAADLVVVVSTPLRDIIAGLGVDPARIVVIPNGVDPHRFQPASGSDDLRSQLGLSGRVVIGFVGWFRSWHGLDFLLHAFQASEALRRSASVLLVGDGPETPVLRSLVKDYGLEDNVVFTGPLPHSRVAAYVELFDIAVQPAANEYCCPMKIIEYLAMAKPVVAPRQANILDLVEDGVESVLFDPGSRVSLTSALERLAGDPELRRATGRFASEAISGRRFLWTGNAERVIDKLGFGGKPSCQFQKTSPDSGGPSTRIK